MTPWFPPDVVPVRRGFYQRDHRKVNEYIDPTDRRIWLDLWEPVDKGCILYPGVWYVQEPAGDINDASQQRLPWRGLTEPSK